MFKNLADLSHMYYTLAMLNSRTKEGFFKKIVVKFFFSRLRNFCFAVYFYLFVKFSGLFLPVSCDPRHLGILSHEKFSLVLLQITNYIIL